MNIFWRLFSALLLATGSAGLAATPPSVDECPVEFATLRIVHDPIHGGGMEFYEIYGPEYRLQMEINKSEAETAARVKILEHAAQVLEAELKALEEGRENPEAEEVVLPPRDEPPERSVEEIRNFLETIITQHGAYSIASLGDRSTGNHASYYRFSIRNVCGQEHSAKWIIDDHHPSREHAALVAAFRDFFDDSPPDG